MARSFFQVVSGARQGLNIPLEPNVPVVIGRKRGDLILDDPLVSSTHCRVMERDGQVSLQDLGSTNGTMVDGRLVREAILRPGSEIAIGGSRLVLFVGESAPAADPNAASANARAKDLAQIDIAWLLDEELVEIDAAKGSPVDVIGQDLRLPPGLVASVEVTAGQDVGQVFRFKRGNLTVGRRTGEIPLNDVEVSRNHAVIEVFGRDMIYLRDLGSTNGTYHNGRRVGVARLENGDTVGVGKTVMKLQITR